MMEKEKSVLQLLNSFPKVTDMKINYFVDSNTEDLKFDISLDSKIQSNDLSDSTIISNLLILNIREREKDIKIKVEYLGKFQLHNTDTIDKNTKDYLINKSTTAILFPFVRAYVSVITAQANIGTVVLPVIDVNRFIQNNKENENK